MRRERREEREEKRRRRERLDPASDPARTSFQEQER